MSNTPDTVVTLLPCPFCGGPVELEKTIRKGADGRVWWGVVCRNTMGRGGTCAIQQRPSASEEAAVERWNTRMNQALDTESLVSTNSDSESENANRVTQALDTADVPARGKTISDATRRMAKIMGAEFVPYDNPASDTADEGMVERVKNALGQCKDWDGEPFFLSTSDDELETLALAAIEATGVSTLLARVERLEGALVEAAIPLEALLICRTMATVDLADATWAEIESAVKQIREVLAIEVSLP
jgi:hypothetical protein